MPINLYLKFSKLENKKLKLYIISGACSWPGNVRKLFKNYANN